MEAKIKKAIEAIQYYYLSDKRVLDVSYSGGKDSSVVLSLAVQAISALPADKRTKSIHVLYSDTLLEMPPVIEEIDFGISSFKQYVKSNNLPFSFDQVEPELQARFLNKVIGAGDPLPNSGRRWCTDVMKIKPMEKAVKKMLENSGNFGYIAITGSRKDESVDRRDRLERNSVDGAMHLKKHADPKCNLLCPIEDWSKDDVWEYLFNYSSSWVNVEGLIRMYSEASGDGDECSTVLEGGEAGKKPGCSLSARYGCWLCPLFERDKTLNNLAQNNDYLIHMETFRNWLVSFRDGQWDSVRDVFNHRDKKRLQYSYDNNRYGFTSPGGYTLEFRKEILRRLLETEAMVRKTKEMRLISDADLSYIQSRWIQDGDIYLSCVEIASHFGRTVEINNHDAVVVEMATELFEIKDKCRWDGYLPAGFGIYANERFCIQFILERYGLKKGKGRRSDFNAIESEFAVFIKDLTTSKNANDILATALMGMKMHKQFYPSEEMERMIRKEWLLDTGSVLTKMIVSESSKKDGDAEQWYDPVSDESVSLEDKVDFFDNWEYYNNQACDASENEIAKLYPDVYATIEIKPKSSTPAAIKKTTKDKDKSMKKRRESKLQKETKNAPTKPTAFGQLSFSFAA